MTPLTFTKLLDRDGNRCEDCNKCDDPQCCGPDHLPMWRYTYGSHTGIQCYECKLDAQEGYYA